MLLLVQSACQPLSPVLEAPLALHRLTRSHGVAADTFVMLQTTVHTAQGEADGHDESPIRRPAIPRMTMISPVLNMMSQGT